MGLIQGDIASVTATREQQGRSHTMYTPGDPVSVVCPLTQNPVAGVVVSCRAWLHCSVVDVKLDATGKTIRVAGDRVTRRGKR